jgi:hypothetical protein
MMSVDGRLAALAARIEQLGAECAQLRRENMELRARVGLERPRPSAAISAASGGPISRRGMLGKALGAAALGVAGVSLLESKSPAAAADGDAVKAGDLTLAESSTTVRYDGAGGFTGIVLFGNDSVYSPDTTFYPAAVGGWAGAGATAGAGGVRHGVYGYTDNAAGHGVIGFNAAGTDGGGAAVFGRSNRTDAIRGESASTADGARAVYGLITTTTPGDTSVGVRGQNDGTGRAGFGVWGSQAGSGVGVYGAAPTGVGVFGSSAHGIGVRAKSRSIAVQAQGQNGIAVAASSGGSRPTVRAVNTGTGRGGVFAGHAAQVQLTPGGRRTHPVRGSRGDLYADSSGRLWFCKRSGARATWKQIA